MTQYRTDVCYHEAAHVVAAFRYGFSCDKAVVNENGSGWAMSMRWPLVPKTTDVVFRHLIELAAGHLARVKYLESVGDEDLLDAVEDDFDTSRDWKDMCQLTEDMGTLGRAMRWAERMVEKDWHLIEQVAKVLMEDGFYNPDDAVGRLMQRKRFRSQRLFKMPGTYRCADTHQQALRDRRTEQEILSQVRRVMQEALSQAAASMSAVAA